MFKVNEDNSIYATRGDVVCFAVTAEDNGEAYIFQTGDVIRLTVSSKKNCEDIVLQKDFPIASETQEAEIILTEEDTKFGGVISKPTDFWYEIELNPFTNPQTIVGYDEDGAKIFKLFPDGKDLTDEETVEPEDIPIVDGELDLTSTRPIQNQAVTKRLLRLEEEIKKISEQIAEGS